MQDLIAFWVKIYSNEAVLPTYLGIFNNPKNSDNPDMTDEFAKQFAQLAKYGFLTTDSQMERNDKDYIQKAYIAGWLPNKIADAFLDHANMYPNIVAFYSALPATNPTKLHSLRLGVTFSADRDAKNAVVARKMWSSCNLANEALFENEFASDWPESRQKVKRMLASMREVTIINTDCRAKMGTLLQLTLAVLAQTAKPQSAK
jgi:hypothetical protein